MVASSFTGGVTSKGSSWKLCDVDPEDAGEGELTIQLDGAIYAHYMPMVQRLSRNGGRCESVNNVDCDLVRIGEGVSVGLVRGLRDVIADRGNMGVGFGDQGSNARERNDDGCFRRVSEFFHSIEGFQGLIEDEKVSMGGDGVVVVLGDEYVRSLPEVDRAL